MQSTISLPAPSVIDMAFTKSAEIFPAERIPHLIEDPNAGVEEIEGDMLEVSGKQKSTMKSSVSIAELQSGPECSSACHYCQILENANYTHDNTEPCPRRHNTLSNRKGINKRPARRKCKISRQQ